MKNTYFDLIDQTYSFPREEFGLQEGFLSFHDIPLKRLIQKYGTPLRLTYLPKIGYQIEKARRLFQEAIEKARYKGTYHYCYCTKCNHFAHVVCEALKHGVHLETSSSFDIDLILHLLREKKINTEVTIINNGYKTEEYLRRIVELIESGFQQVIVVLDSKKEGQRLMDIVENKPVKIGLRMAVDGMSPSAHRTSRLGIRHDELLDFYRDCLKGNERLELNMLHFFVDSGIEDSTYYWAALQHALHLYVELKRECDTLRSFNLGGGFPIRNHLAFDYDYASIAHSLVDNIKATCDANGVAEPDIFTEFGKYTVGESGAFIFKVLEQKQQNDTENWYLIDNSLMNTLPDVWSMNERFLLLPINKWHNTYQSVHIGGMSCDRADHYNPEGVNRGIFLPDCTDGSQEPLYIGFFHTGAYQDAISGYGGVKHCLIPAPQQVIVDRDEKGNAVDTLYRHEQSADEMLALLGYCP